MHFRKNNYICSYHWLRKYFWNKNFQIYANNSFAKNLWYRTITNGHCSFKQSKKSILLKTSHQPYTSGKSKSGAVVKHQRLFVVLKTTSNVKRLFKSGTAPLYRSLVTSLYPGFFFSSSCLTNVDEMKALVQFGCYQHIYELGKGSVVL